jgi:hypothetical protein
MAIYPKHHGHLSNLGAFIESIGTMNQIAAN